MDSQPGNPRLKLRENFDEEPERKCPRKDETFGGINLGQLYNLLLLWLNQIVGIGFLTVEKETLGIRSACSFKGPVE